MIFRNKLGESYWQPGQEKTGKKIGRKMKTKLFALFMLIVVAMLGLIGRLMFIEYTSGDAYTKRYYHYSHMTANNTVSERKYCGFKRDSACYECGCL